MSSDTMMLLDELRTAFDEYLRCYFTERNFNKAVALLDENITGIGSARDEIALNYQDFLSLYSRDISQCPHEVMYQELFFKSQLLSPTMGIVITCLNISSIMGSLPFGIPGLRITLVMNKEKGKWLISHMHVSQEQRDLPEGESFPVSELEEKNLILEKIIEQRTYELTKALEEVKIVAATDVLTGTYNRRKFNDILEYEVHRAQRTGAPLTMILGDIDDFKVINDHYGHLIGDEVLRSISEKLKGCVRQSDMLARWGGEEFIILLPGVRLDRATEIAEAMRVKVAGMNHEMNIVVTMSFGVAEYQRDESCDDLLKRADYAMYTAKYSGRNQVMIANFT